LFDSHPLAPPSNSIAMTATTAIFHHFSRRASVILHRSQQELDIAFGSGNRARSHAKHGPALPFNPAFRLNADSVVHCGIADDAALSHFLAPGLELGLDQRDQSCTG